MQMRYGRCQDREGSRARCRAEATRSVSWWTRNTDRALLMTRYLCVSHAERVVAALVAHGHEPTVRELDGP